MKKYEVLFDFGDIVRVKVEAHSAYVAVAAAVIELINEYDYKVDFPYFPEIASVNLLKV